MKERRLDDRYFTEPLATKLEELRDEAREKRRITYDCYNAVAKEDKVVCKLGHFTIKNGLTPLLSVLRGRSALVCQGCPDYSGDE